jgi:hypothetical protein
MIQIVSKLVCSYGEGLKYGYNLHPKALKKTLKQSVFRLLAHDYVSILARRNYLPGYALLCFMRFLVVFASSNRLQDGVYSCTR